jgi:lysozyme family protein
LLKSNFSNCLAETLIWENGYSNHPKDPGGATMNGVIQRVYNSYRRLKGLAPRSVKLISKAEIQDIYKDNYWNQVKGDLLPSGLDLAVFDFGVNSGPSRAVKFLQKTINKVEGRRLAIDGRLGSATLDAVTSLKNIPGVIAHLCDSRRSWLQTLKTWATFGKGWNRRALGIKAKALELAHSAPLAAPQARPAVPPSLGAPGDVQTPSEAPVAVSITGIIGLLGTGLVQAINNPYALAFMLVALGLGGLLAYRFLAPRQVSFS